MKRDKIIVNDRQLACARIASPEGQDYLKGMAAAGNYAWVNRSSMTFLTRQVQLQLLVCSWLHMRNLNDLKQCNQLKAYVIWFWCNRYSKYWRRVQAFVMSLSSLHRVSGVGRRETKIIPRICLEQWRGWKSCSLKFRRLRRKCSEE